MLWIFPNGISHYLIGGILIGVATSLIFIFTGLRAGASSFFTSTWSYISKHPFFRQARYLEERGWRTALALGILLGATAYTMIRQDWFVTDVAWWRLLLGGILVGIGTRTSRGCTSGHGICGVSSGKRPSFVAVITFLAIGILTALLVSGLGVRP